MPKNTTIFSCSKCGAQAPKWSGRCLLCGAWGTMEEELQTEKKEKAATAPAGKTKNFKEIEGQNVSRNQTGIDEFDRVLGGGIVPGSLVLLGGEPGIGKSTLILQTAALTSEKQNIIYVSGEESGEQIKLRLDRLKLNGNNLKFLGETDIDIICSTINKERPTFAIVDSIQTCFTSELPGGAGSVGQVRTCTVKLLEVAKKNHIAIFIVGHVTKEGEVAGPKTLEHLVDTVLYLEGERYHSFRILRTIKNRFGSTGEIGIFEMTGEGLKEVLDPSAVFLGENKRTAPGAAIACVLEGSRPLLVEIQALVNKTNFGYPQRKSEGFPLNRLQLLIAVLTQKAKLPLQNYDVYINVAGGLKIAEPAADLAVAAAIYSALKNKNLPQKTIFLGEISLSGEIRNVMQSEKRFKEIEKLGFLKVVSGKISVKTKLNLTEVKDIGGVLDELRIMN